MIDDVRGGLFSAVASAAIKGGNATVNLVVYNGSEAFLTIRVSDTRNTYGYIEPTKPFVTES